MKERYEQEIEQLLSELDSEPTDTAIRRALLIPLRRWTTSLRHLHPDPSERPS